MNDKISKLIAEIEAHKPDPRIEAMIPKPPVYIRGEEDWRRYAPRTDDRVEDLAVFLRRALGLPAGDIDLAIAANFSDLSSAQVEEARQRAA